MSKAILLVDMPESCEDCELCTEDNYADYHCVALLESVNIYKKEKLKDCPLKPLQQHKLTDLEKTTDYSCGWEQGYNACIDELLGEEL